MSNFTTNPFMKKKAYAKPSFLLSKSPEPEQPKSGK